MRRPVANAQSGKPEATPELYARVFENTPDGQVILEDLVARFARQALRRGGIDAILETYGRDGERRVVEFIVAQINRAAGIVPAATEEET